MGQLNLGTLFPDLQYYLTSTVSFCEANRVNIERACSIGAGSNTLANSSVLLGACTSFLTNGALTSASQASNQVVLACSVLAVQMSLLCSSQTGTDCKGLTPTVPCLETLLLLLCSAVLAIAQLLLTRMPA